MLSHKEFLINQNNSKVNKTIREYHKMEINQRNKQLDLLYDKCNRSINPRYRKVVVPGIHTAENHDFISSDQGSRSSISKSLLCSARSGNMLSR